MVTLVSSTLSCGLAVQAVFDDYEEGDVVWCQDYHLMLLPALLKARYPKMKVSIETPDRSVCPKRSHGLTCMRQIAGNVYAPMFIESSQWHYP